MPWGRPTARRGHLSPPIPIPLPGTCTGSPERQEKRHADPGSGFGRRRLAPQTRRRPHHIVIGKGPAAPEIRIGDAKAGDQIPEMTRIKGRCEKVKGVAEIQSAWSGVFSHQRLRDIPTRSDLTEGDPVLVFIHDRPQFFQKLGNTRVVLVVDMKQGPVGIGELYTCPSGVWAIGLSPTPGRGGRN